MNGAGHVAAPDPDRTPERSRLGAGCMLGALLGMLLCVLGMGTLIFAVVHTSRIPLTSVLALALVVGVLVHAWWSSRDGVLFSSATAVLPAVVLIAMGAVAEEWRPVISREGVGGGDVLVLLYLHIPGMLVGCVITGVVGGFLGTQAPPRAERDEDPWRDRWVKAAVLAACTSLLVALPGWIRRPSPERWLASLPVLGQLDALPQTYGGPQCEDRRDVVEQSATFGDIHVRRNNRCGCGINLAAGRDPESPSLSFMTWYKMDLGPGPYAPCGKLTFRLDPTHRLALVDDDGAYGPRAYRHLADGAGEMGPMVDVTRAELAGATGPSSWRVLPALAGVAIAASVLRRKGALGGRGRFVILATLLPSVPLCVALLARVVG